MPKLPKLATGTIDPTVNGGISPSGGLISDRTDIGTPRISVNAADEQFTPLKQSPIVEDPTLKNTLTTGNIILDKTKEIADRKQTYLAKEAVLQYKATLRDLYYGTKDKQGYQSLIGVDANDAYEDYTKQVDNELTNIVSKLDPAVRAKALIQLSEQRNNYLNLGAVHNSRQLTVAENQTRAVEADQIKKDIMVGGTRPWVDGTIERHLEQYTDIKQRNAVAEVLATDLLYNTYNKEMAGADPDPIKAINEVQNNYDEIRDMLPVDTRIRLDHWVLQRKDQAQRYQQTIGATKLKAAKLEIATSAPFTIQSAIEGNNINLAHATTHSIKQLYADDQQKGSKLVADAWNKAITNEAYKYTDPLAAIQAATDLYNNVFGDPKNIPADYNDYEISTIRNYVKYKLPKDIYDRKESMDALKVAEYGSYLSQVKPDDFIATQPPKDLTVKYKKRWLDLNEQYIASHRPDFTPKNEDVYYLNETMYEAKISNDDVTAKDIQDATSLAAKGQLPITMVSRLSDARRNKLERGNKKLPWQEDPNYIATQNTINKYIQAKMSRVRSSERIYDLQKQKANMIIWLNREARLSYEAGRSFDGKLFLNKALEAAKDNKIISPDWYQR